MSGWRLPSDQVPEQILGEPDLLRWTGEGYIPGDIKSGAGEEGTEDARRPKPIMVHQALLNAD